MIKLVAIDFDDTLSLTEQATFAIENETAALMGFPPMSHEAHLKNWGKPLEQAIVERIPGIDPKEFMHKVIEIHQRYIAEGKADIITSENVAFLDHIQQSLAILTSRTLPEIKHLLHKNHVLHARIEKFYHKDNSLFVKPDPRVFDQILKDFSVQPDEAVYLGDSIGDAMSAKGAGLHFIAVLESGIRTKEDFNDYPVDFFATTLPEALTYITSH